MALAASARSGIVSIRVPSRSISTAWKSGDVERSLDMRLFRKPDLNGAGAGLDDFVAHGLDDRLIIGRAENGGAGNEGVGTGSVDRTDVLDLDAAVDFQPDGLAAGLDPGIDATARFTQLVQGSGNELLPAETGVHRHEQNHVELVHDVVHPAEGSGRIEYQTGLAAVVADQRKTAIDVAGRLGVEGDDVGAGLGELRDNGVD